MNKTGILAMCFMAGNMLAFGQDYDITLTGTESGTKSYAVYNSVTLGPGYSYSPSGGTLTVNPMVSGSVDYVATPVDPETRTLNTSLMVGATNGSFNVNTMGGASYSIPLELPPGVNGLTPGLSLVYSSNAGPGIAGYGWQIAGFSGISRGPRTFFDCGETMGVELDTTDRFYLDGERLINTSTFYHSYTQVQYQTHNDMFTRVTPKDMVAYDIGPSWFMAETKSGLKYEYGNTADSKQKIDIYPHVVNWYVSKITDLFGNKIDYTYLQDNYSVYPAEIKYGPNIVRFIYKERNDKNYRYLKGTKIEQRLILDKIIVKYNDHTVKTYEFKYNNKGSSYNTYSILNEVIEYGLGGSRVNSTAFTYSLPENVSFTQAVYNSTDTYLSYGSRLLSGDFNGDGKSDIFCLPSGGGWRSYINNGDNTFTFITSGSFAIDETSITSMSAVDLNADQKEDLVFYIKSGSTTKYYYALSNGMFFDEAVLIVEYANSIGLYKTHRSTGDINGDGFNDIVIIRDNGDLVVFSCDLYPSGAIKPLGYQFVLNFGSAVNLSDKYYFSDYNGDGLTDVWKITSAGIKIYTIRESSLAELYSGTFPVKDNHFLLDDFNADGKTDMFVYGLASTDYTNWLMYLSKETGFDMVSIPQKKANLKNDIVRNGDFDGDGSADLLVTAANDNGWTGRYYYLSSQSGTNFTSVFENGVVANYNYYINDYNGDGRDDYLSTDAASPWWTGYRLNHSPGRTGILMVKVGDGLGNITKINYTKLSQATIATYRRSTGAVFPVADYVGPISVVSSVQYDNGRGSLNTQQYYYEALRVHLRGKGFLGFMKSKTTDVTAGIETEYCYDYNTTYYNVQLNSVSKKLVGQTSPFETTTNTWSVKVLDAARKRIFPFVQSSTQSSALTGHSVTVTSDYDNYGNPTVVTKSYNNGVSETVTNVYNNTVSATAWLLGRPTSTTVVNTNANGSVTRTTTRVFSTTNNNLTRINELAGTDKQVSKIFSYNSNGTLATETVAAGSTSRATQFTYDNNGIRVTSVTDPLAHKNYNSYDEYGRLTEQKDFLNNTITYGYDNFHRQVSILMSTGNGTSTTYSWQNPQSSPTYARYAIETTSGDGSYAKVWYDKLGREIQSGVKGFNGSMVYTNTEYNTKGQLYRVSEPRLSTTLVWNVMTYDAYGRRTGMTTPSGRNSTWQYNTNTVTVTTGGKTYSKTYASDGTLTLATDAGGTLSYTYYPDGMLKTITAPGGVVTSLEYDIAGNKTRLTDPSAGNLVYTYNAFGELLSQKNARNQTTYYVYATDGRLTQKTAPEGNTYYYYNTNKQLSGITSADGVARNYEYDPNGRVTAIAETIPGSSEFSTTFTYDQIGRLATKTHPSGITETNNYNSYGYLASVSAGGATRWTTTAVNERGQVTGGRYGSNLTTTFSYDPYGYPTSTVTGSLQSYQYSFSTVTGNLDWRKNVKSNIQENFEYDGLDRLDRIYRESATLQDMAYNTKGSIVAKTDVGTLQYNRTDKPYVITGIDPATGIIPSISQSIDYTSFESVNSITEDNHIATFIYNGNDQRARMAVTEAGNPILTRWYFGGSYIKETTQSATKEYTFIGGDAYTAPAVAITENGIHTYYYLLRDHLGSITHVVNASNNSVAAEYSYDAWGRMRNTSTWVNHSPGSEPALMIAGRGYTGHEHLPWFNLINMNGRVYDPLTGQMLSPDNYIQSPGYTQSYNRYAYAGNNPLKYTDPSGNILKPQDFEPLPPMFSYHIGSQFLPRGTDNSNSYHNYIESLGVSISFTYNPSTGGYEKNGQPVPYNVVYHQGILPNSDNYLISETAYLNDEGKWVGNGNFGIVKQGRVVSDGSFPSFHSYTDASNYLNSIKNAPSGGGGGYLYYLAEWGGHGHSMVWNPYSNKVYEIHIPGYGRDAVSTLRNIWWWSTGQGARKSVRYVYNMRTEQHLFYTTSDRINDGKIDIRYAKVWVPNLDAAISFFESDPGGPWEYSLISSNCKHYAIMGLRAGGASIQWSGPVPVHWQSPLSPFDPDLFNN